ncbi:ABC transporter ATP-binding protein [Salirhabdus sp. Marseille-P4669]|uniref:ABC transporter ATP-binding protein n=1 Tax=Salirhabdus sp. Marseille-P4669 TaxID=2042310 RepID=UPI000C7CAADB|nr:ABC transporter ATP-binding protein [Salirhabdus sp. Marseille-P4669]
MIKVEGLTKKINNKTILKDINVSVPNGSITGIVGRNGAGKTTLLRLVAGILKPSQGRITLNDQDVFQYPQVKQDIVFVPDTTDALRQYTVKEIVSLYKRIYNQFNEEEFYQLLSRFEMKESGKIKAFSKGQKALFSLILAFSTNAKFLLLDEPTDGLDVIVKKEILRFIAGAVAEKGVSVLISSHRLDELEALADHIVVLKNGVVDSEMEMDVLKQQYCKIQVAYQEGFPEALRGKVHMLNESGRVYVLLLEKEDEETIQQLKLAQPILYEELPLSLEDIFIAKLGGDTFGS